ncbi:hypothetical protein [Campylobacter sp. RM12651]|uniref:hypothetical protein n=1 Tax=Campylobacter sp. RM12651 TaxID=1660079 RepID=UPI001EFB5091|nr:hypothetical protein [Campylobacter sp. RM12651]ULO04507.1 hypothetical protein AVBRAN_a0025 [Campylobacter sp. RM12651]
MAVRSDGKNVVYDDIQERVMRPKRDNFYDAFTTQESINFITTSLNFMGIGVGIYLVFMIIFKQQYIFSKEVLIFFLLWHFPFFRDGHCCFFWTFRKEKRSQ